MMAGKQKLVMILLVRPNQRIPVRQQWGRQADAISVLLYALLVVGLGFYYYVLCTS